MVGHALARDKRKKIKIVGDFLDRTIRLIYWDMEKDIEKNDEKMRCENT